MSTRLSMMTPQVADVLGKAAFGVAALVVASVLVTCLIDDDVPPVEPIVQRDAPRLEPTNTPAPQDFAGAIRTPTSTSDAQVRPLSVAGELPRRGAESEAQGSHGVRIHVAARGTLPTTSVDVLIGTARALSGACDELPIEGSGEAWTQPCAVGATAVFRDVPCRIPLAVATRIVGGTWRPEPQQLLVLEGHWIDKTIVVDPGGRVSGQLVGDDGQPLVGCEVLLAPNPHGEDRYLWADEVLSSAAYVGGRGEFAFEGLAVGTWIVGCRSLSREDGDEWRESPAPFGKSFSITDENPEARLLLRVSRGLRIEGTLKLPDGGNADEPILVVARSTEGQQLDVLAEDGTFVIGPLQAGEYTVQAVGDSSCALQDSNAVRARAGDHDVVLRVKRGHQIVVVPISDTDAMPLAFMEIFVSPSSASVRSSPRISGGVGTRFSVGGLSDGDVDVFVRSSDGRAGVTKSVALTPIAAIPQEVPIRMSRAALLQVENSSGAWVLFSLVSGGTLVEQKWACPGAVTSSWIPPGPVVVEIRSGRARVLGGPQHADLEHTTRVRLESSD